MARIGLTNIWFSNLTEGSDGTATYDGAKHLGKAVSTNFSPTNSDASLYGDDALAETDNATTGGTITLGITDDDDTIFAPLLGHDITGGEVTYKSTDSAPYVGCGYVLTKMVNGARKWKVDFFYKVKFAEMSYDQNTRGESVEFTTPSVEGKIAVLGDEDGTWRKSETFDTLSDALTYLKGLMTAPVTTKYTVTYDVNGGTGTVVPVEVTAGESVSLDDGSGITPPTNKTFKGWGLSEDATETVASPYTPTGNVTLYAIYQNAE